MSVSHLPHPSLAYRQQQLQQKDTPLLPKSWGSFFSALGPPLCSSLTYLTRTNVFSRSSTPPPFCSFPPTHPCVLPHGKSGTPQTPPEYSDPTQLPSTPPPEKQYRSCLTIFVSFTAPQITHRRRCDTFAKHLIVDFFGMDTPSFSFSATDFFILPKKNKIQKK